MKKKTPTGIAEDALGLVFFSECLDELLYEFTPPRYKPRVVSLHQLISESQEVLALVEDEAIHSSRLDSVLLELEARLVENPVASGLLDFEPGFYVCKDMQGNLIELRTRLGLLDKALRVDAYRAELEREIGRVCADDREKRRIHQLARSWIGFLLGQGYFHDHIQAAVKSVTQADSIELRVPADLAKLFGKFSLGRVDHEVAFLAKGVHEDADPLLLRFRAKTISAGNPEYEKIIGAGLNPAPGEKLILFGPRSSVDPHRARRSAEKLLEHASDLLALFHHKAKLVWGGEALVRPVNGEWTKLSPGKAHFSRVQDGFPEKAPKKAAGLIEGARFEDEDTVNRFISVVRLHGAAMEAASAEAQIVNIWTAMEVLVPRETGSKLNSVRDTLLPFLVHGHTERIVYWLCGDLMRWDRRRVGRVLGRVRIDGVNRLRHRLAVVLVDPRFEGLKNELFEIASAYRLLRFRLHQVCELLRSRKSVRDSLDLHEKLVRWQIERIYRARNQVVHDGSAPVFIDQLVENAHVYLDAFIDKFVRMAADEVRVGTIEQAVVLQRNRLGVWRRELSSSEPITAENVVRVLALN